MYLLLSWWERNIFYNNYYISKYRINIIKTDFGESISYGSSFQSECLGYNTYIGPRIFKRDNATPIQVHVLKNKNIYITKYIF